MNTLLLIFLAPFLTSTAVGQVESVQIQSSFFETTALKFYCRYGSVLNEDVSGCTPKTVVQEQPQQTVQEKVVEVVRNVFVPVASAQEPSDSYLESMIRRIVLELLPQPQVITVKGEKGDKGDKGDPGTSGSNLLAFDGIQMPFWSGYGSGPSTSGGSTVINNNVNVTSNTLSYSTTTGLLTSDVGGVIGTTTILVTSSSAPSWLLAGNAGTNSATDFLGTTDAQDLVFRTNNVEQLRITQTGRLLAPNATDSIFIDGGNETMTGVSNIGIGDGAVGSNTTGISNIALGQNALLFNTTGFSNMAIGQATLLMNNGNTNTAIGQGAGIVSTGNSNTFIGYGAGNTQSAGDNNIVIGQLANTGNGIGSNQLSIGNWIYGDNGNIGIGQSLPTERLDVIGNIQFSGALMPNNLSGALGTVLISQGAGLAPVWVSTSTLSGTTTNVVSFATTTGIFTSTVNGVVSTTTIPSSSGAWLLTGNTGTNANINFLGTTDNVDLVFKTNNATSGRITNDGQSTAFGLNAGNNASRFNTFFVGSGAGDSATNADYSTFIGIDSGNGATNASYSNFFGENAGRLATSANNSNFFGHEAGQGATSAVHSNFFGNNVGLNAVNSEYSNFFTQNAGSNATNAYQSNFFGQSAGANASNANDSNFFGTSAGSLAANANNSNFFGPSAGSGATDASNSNFFGPTAGQSATDASNANFFGNSAGNGATFANDSNFFGLNTGNFATNAFFSNFFGQSAGNGATNASRSNFFGQNAGNGASSAVGSNFFGANAGNGATNASFSNFFGAVSGLAATAASNSNFFGTAAGANATNASNSNFFGANAGENGTNAFNSSFFGTNAGYQATNASNSNFFGTDTGSNAIDAYASNFFGINAGNGATNANSSNFYGANAGYQAVNAFGSNFFGPDAGSSATNASRSNFFGDSAGQNSVNASYSNFLGYRAGENAPNAANSIFIGQRAGFNDVVNNTVSGTSILIGDDTSTGGFSNSIVLGANATNTASNQLYIRDAITNFNLAGVNYNFPTTQGATGTVLTNNGTGGLTWLTPATTSISSSTIAANFGFIQNGNSFGTSATLGTNDNFGLTFETVNTPRITINQTGSVNVAGETLGAGTYTMNVGAGASSHALRITGVSDTIYAQQGAGANVFFIRTAGTNTFLNASAGNTLAFGVGGTTQNDLQIDPNGDTSVRRRFFVSDSFAGSGTARVGATVASAVASVSDQTGNTTQLLIQPNDGGLNSTATNIGLNVNMGGLSGGTNYAAIFQNGNVGIGTAAPSESLQVVGNILANAIMPNGPYGSNVSNYDLGSTTARWREVWTNIVNVGGASTWSLVNNATRLDFSAGASGSGAERVTFLTGGEVGIGNTTPTDRLHVGNASGPSVRISVDSATQAGVVFKEGGTARWSLIHGDLGNGVFGLLNHFNSSYALSVSSTSNIGLSNNNPLFILHTGSSSIVSGTTVARFENAGGTCDVTPNVAGGITCTSDQNLKKDIESIDPIDTLTRLLTVEVKSYRMNADTSTSTKQTGFLAQQLETQFPGLVLTSIEGTKSVSYAGMTPILTQAIQTLYKFMTDIGVTIEGGVAKIGNFFAKKVTTEELCVGNVCVTESQFLQMVQSTQAASNVVNTELSGENSSDNETINNTPEVSGSNLSEDQINEEGTNQLSGTPLNVETNLSNIEPVVETMSDAVVSTDSIE